MKAKLLALALIVALGQTGCVNQPINQGSYTSGVTAANTEILADAIARYVAYKLPAANSTVNVIPARQKDRLATALTANLKNRGFGIADGTAPNPSAVPLAYQVTPLENGLLIVIRLNGQEVTNMLIRDTQTKQWSLLNSYTVKGG
ncbi:hypothetical protein [Alkanindiges illinoisensis]|uniref:hypothetical protein n=1 Tax=Alkanindiges illinoisensis TaxID=197183 RepID=UPI0004792A07|nr:hypothetical protein [Alkanindiges illinoisensis]